MARRLFDKKDPQTALNGIVDAYVTLLESLKSSKPDEDGTYEIEFPSSSGRVSFDEEDPTALEGTINYNGRTYTVSLDVTPKATLSEVLDCIQSANHKANRDQE